MQTNAVTLTAYEAAMFADYAYNIALGIEARPAFVRVWRDRDTDNAYAQKSTDEAPFPLSPVKVPPTVARGGADRDA